MTTKTNLRELARQYADGMLDRDAYRQARSELLDSILDDHPTDPPATDPNTDFSVHQDIARRTENRCEAHGADDTTSGEDAEPPSTASTRSRIWPTAVLIAIILAGLWLVLR